MKRLAIVFLIISGFVTTSCKSQTQNNSMKTETEKEIKNVIETFVKAGEERNIPMYNAILHEDFRVIANRYPTPEKTSIIPAAGYIALLAKKVIGGTKYEVIYNKIDITEHSATVIAELKAEEGGQFVTFLLVQNQENKWQIIADMATQQEK